MLFVCSIACKRILKLLFLLGSFEYSPSIVQNKKKKLNMAEYMNVICKYGDTIEIEMEKKDKMRGNRNSAVHPPE